MQPCTRYNRQTEKQTLGFIYLMRISDCNITNCTCLFSVYTVNAQDAKLDVPPETLEGEGALMRCTIISGWSNDRLEWYKGGDPNTRKRVFLYVRAAGLHRASNDLVNTTVEPNKDRAVGRMVGNVYELYINKTVLSDEAIYSCRVDLVYISQRLTVNGE